MHDPLAILISVQVLADATSSTTIKAGLIAALALVASTTIPSLIGRKEREPRILVEYRKTQARLLREVSQDRDDWKVQSNSWQHKYEVLYQSHELVQSEITRLQNLCRDNGIDPIVHEPEGAL